MTLRTRPFEQAGRERWPRASSGLGFHRIGQPPDLLDINGHPVSGFEPAGRIRGHPDPMRRSGKNSRASKQVVLPLKNSMIEGTSKIMSFVFQSWTGSAIQESSDGQGIGVGHFVGSYDARTERTKGIEGFSATPLTAAPSSSASPARSRRWRTCNRAQNPMRSRGTRFCMRCR